MQVKQTSLLTGVTRVKELPVTEAQMQRWMNGEHIQYVMPHISADDREFIKTGITKEEWDELMK